MARSFLGGEFAGGESAWWRGDWIPFKYVPFTNVMSVFPRSNLNGVPLKSEVTFSALVTDKDIFSLFP